MLILGIETSCDETAISVVENGQIVHSNVISSSKESFARMGGVMPEEAARQQVECLLPVLHSALTHANIDSSSLDAIAVTKGPGLLGSLLVGTTSARALAALWNVPLIGVHHTVGHLTSPWLGIQELPSFPLLSLSVSGGHSDMWLRQSHTKADLLGSTRDDAAGEAFDKGAVQLGLTYPGGPAIAKAALNGNADAYAFPLPLSGEDSLDFSFSGLKTSLRYLLRDLNISSPDMLSSTQRADIAASYQKAICNHLLDRAKMALTKHSGVQEFHVVGGVSANTVLRSMLQENYGTYTIRFPAAIEYCTDNGAMIAAAGYYLFQELGEEAFAEFTT